MVDIKTGTIIDDRYKVLEQLGSGGMGTVYKAWDLEDGQDVALKTLNRAVNREDVRRRFQREFHLLSKIEHPRIVRPHEWGLYEGRPYFSMAFLPGQMLSDIMAEPNGRELLRGRWFFSLVRQVGEGLAYVHEQGMVHRDLKPSNIMVCETEDGADISATILDLGLVRFRGASEIGLTHSGEAVGTVEYMSPEQAKGVWVDQRSDLYSLGVMLYEILTGRPPFAGEGAVSVILRHIRETPTPPRDLNTQISEPLQKVVLKLLEKEPIDRYQSVSEFLKDVDALEPRDTLVVTPEGRPPAKPAVRTLRPQFLGREYEMKVLREHLNAAMSGTVCMPLISGVSGMGKSWLLEQLQGDARIFGFQVLKGMCYEAGGRAYGPLIEAFQRAGGLRPPALFFNQNQGESADRYVVLEQVAEFVKNMAKMQPVLLCLEDVQWADELTLEFLRWMQRDQESVPLMICLTCRTEEAGALPEEVSGLGESDAVVPVVLVGVTEEETGYLAASMLGERQIPDLAAKAIYDETEGNPFYIVEVVQKLLDQNIVEQHEEQGWIWHDIPETLLPHRLSDVLHERVEIVSKKQRRVLEYASVFRGPFSFDMISGMWQGNELDLLENIEDLIALGFLQNDDDRSDWYGFAHGKFRETIYEGLSDLKIPLLHREAGRTLESLHGRDESGILDDLAYHFARSTDKGRAFYYLKSAGKQALLAQAYAKALALFKSADEHGDLESDDPDRIEFLKDYALSLHGCGYKEEALKQAEQALTRVSEACPLSLKASVLQVCGNLYVSNQRQDDAEFVLSECLTICRELDDKDGEVKALIALGQVFEALGDVGKAVKYNEMAAEKCDELGEVLPRARANIFRGYGAFIAHRFGEAKKRFESALALLESIGDRRYRQSCLFLLGKTTLYTGPYDLSVKLFNEVAEIWRKRGAKVGEANALLGAGKASLDLGEYGRASDAGKCASVLLQDVGVQQGLYEAYALLAESASMQGDLQEAEKWLKCALPGTELSGGNLTLIWRRLGRAFVESGRIEDARNAFKESVNLISLAAEGEGAQSLFSAGQFDFEQGNWESAYEQLMKAKQIFGQSGAEARLRQTEELLAQIPNTYKEQNNSSVLPSTHVSVFYEVCRDLTSELDLNRLLDRTLDRLLLVTQAERALMVLKDDSADTFHVEVARAHNLQDTAAEEISQGVIRQVMEQNAPVVSLDASSDARFEHQQSVINFGIRAVVCVPLFHAESGVIGALYADHRHIDREFTKSDEELLSAFGDLVSIAVVNARAFTRLQEQRRHLQEQMEVRHGFGELVGRSDAMQPVYRLIEKSAGSDVAVLILGETGTGKELAARAIHYNSARKNQPMRSQNCAALPSELLQSELFGHRRGAFTGADRDRPGLFESADNGTVFLDEIADASPQVQSNLLRVLQEGEVRRLGENVTRKVNVRIIAATNKDLEAEVEAGNFREDLYYRLRVLQVDMPALRTHIEDVPQLAEHLLQRAVEETGKSVDGLSREAVHALMEYSWPGNVRELDNEIKRALALADAGGQITPYFFSERVRSEMLLEDVFAQQDLKARVEAKEKQIIEATLDECEGNVTRTASQLGLSRSGLYKKLTQYGLRE